MVTGIARVADGAGAIFGPVTGSARVRARWEGIVAAGATGTGAAGERDPRASIVKAMDEQSGAGLQTVGRCDRHHLVG